MGGYDGPGGLRGDPIIMPVTHIQWSTSKHCPVCGGPRVNYWRQYAARCDSGHQWAKPPFGPSQSPGHIQEEV